MTGGNFFLWFIIAREVIIFEEPIFTATPNFFKKFFFPKNGENGLKKFFLNILRNSAIRFF